MSRRHLIFVLLLLCIPVSVFSQRIEAFVKLNMDALSEEAKLRLEDFTEKLEYYINDNDRCPNEWNSEVIVEINMVIKDNSAAAEEKYDCQSFVISNSYDVQLSDHRWKFAYDSRENLTFNENNLDSFTSFIEFYLNLILGFEYDKWGTYAGEIYFEKAKNIAEQSRFGLGRFQEGWEKRLELVNYFLSDRFKPFREMVDYYYYGLSFVQEDNEKVRTHISTAIDKLDRILADEPDNEYAQNFLDAHHSEMIEIYKRALDKEPVRKLMVLDPDHKKAYEEIINY